MTKQVERQDQVAVGSLNPNRRSLMIGGRRLAAMSAIPAVSCTGFRAGLFHLGQDLPQKREGRSSEGHLQEPLRHHPGGRSVSAEEPCRQAPAGACRRRPVRRGEGAVVGPLRADHGRAWLRHAGFRSVLYRRKRRRAAQRRLAGHQYRGFQRRRGFSRPAPVRRPRADRHHRHLRLGRHGLECRRRGQARQGRRGQHHVRHDARHVQGLQRQRDPRTAHARRWSN